MDSLRKSNILINNYKRFLIEWNNRFPLDRRFRKKYNISFNSEEHRKTNQVDMFLDLLEDSMVERQKGNYIKYNTFKDEMEKDNQFLVSQEESMTEEEKDDAFELLRKSIKNKINKGSNE